MAKLRRVITLGVTKAILCAALWALVLLVLFQILMRFVPAFYFGGVEESTLLCATYLYFVGMAYVTYEDSHVRCDVLRTTVKNPLTLKYLGIASLLMSICVAGVYSYLAFEHCYYVAAAKQVTVALRAPRIIFMASVLLGFGVTSLFLLFYIVKEIKSLIIEKRRGAP